MNLSLSEIVDLSNRLDKEAKALIKEILRIAWQMRGGITLNEAYMLSYDDRNIIAEIIKENMELTEKSQLPFI